MYHACSWHYLAKLSCRGRCFYIQLTIFIADVSHAHSLCSLPETGRQCQAKAAQGHLEASERRVYVLSSDNASLKRELAEYANVVRQARALADKERQSVGVLVIL